MRRATESLDPPVVPAVMRAMVLTRLGSVEHLAERAVPVPDPRPDEVLIRVRTVAANIRDLITVNETPQGAPPLPHILGVDPAGVVVATGSEVDEPRVGARVVVKPAIACGHCARCRADEEDACQRKETVGVTRPGGFAEYLAVPARNAFALPDELSFAAASALVHSYPVAWHMLDRARVGADDVVLVTSAAGAVGSGAVQLARARGARVVAGARGTEKVAVAAELSADLVIDYEATPSFAGQVRERFPDGATVYVDSAGDPAVWVESLRTLGPHARVVVCGSHAGPIVRLDLSWLFRLRISILGASGSTAAEVRHVLALAGEGKIRSPVDSVLPLRHAKAAFERVEARRNRGKVVLETTFS